MYKNNLRKSTLLSLPVLLSALILTGCGDNMSDLHAYMNEVKARQPAPIEPIPAIKPYVRFIYPGHDTDPFDSAVLEAKTVAEIPESVLIDKNRVPEFLETFQLDSLRMVGTVFKDKELWALIRIPDGAVHRVKTGNYIGKNHGKITSIKDVGLSLSEIVDNGFGGYKERDNELAISTLNQP
ncbi:pilus assembly protein PilP [uncultured Thiothrix sp.]|uniref:pilus assembly protein PilP n=1 Tax=uncultured Thiothrix sp. TaxID=223185 RepID=UPI0026171F67|nr:pilus assembly protein PilP [uncultured Thiothrix sp.]